MFKKYYFRLYNIVKYEYYKYHKNCHNNLYDENYT